MWWRTFHRPNICIIFFLLLLVLDYCMEREGEGEGDQGVCGGGGDKLRRIDILKKRSGQWREEKAGEKKGGNGRKRKEK